LDKFCLTKGANPNDNKIPHLRACHGKIDQKWNINKLGKIEMTAGGRTCLTNE